MSENSSLQRKSGVLYKKSGFPKQFRQRFVSIEGPVLYYFKKEQDRVPRGTLILTGCQVTITNDKSFFSFRITHPETTKHFDFAATLAARRDEWIQAIEEVANEGANQLDSAHLTSSFRSDGSSRDTLLYANDNNSPTETRDISLPTVPEYQGQIDKLINELVANSAPDAKGWRLQSEKRNMRAYFPNKPKFASTRGIATFDNLHPRAILDLVMDLTRKNLYDPQLQQASRLKVIDSHTTVDHLVYKAMFPAAGRDMVNLVHWCVLPDNSIAVVSTEANHHHHDSPKGFVRAKLISGGFHIIPNADYTGAEVVYMVKADLKDGVPASILSKVFLKQAYMLDELRTILNTQIDKSHKFEVVTNDTVLESAICNVDNIIYRQDIIEDDIVEPEMETETIREEKVESPYGQFVIPAEFENDMAQTMEKFNSLISNLHEWNFHSDKNQVKAYTKIENSLTASLGIGTVPFHPRLVFQAIIDVDNLKQLDPMVNFSKRVHKYDEQTYLDYVEYKSVFMVAGRDFSNLIHWRVDQNTGEIYILVKSSDDIKKCPVKEPKIVCGQVHYGGWKIVPTANYSQCKVYYMVKTDLKGSIPSRIANKVAADQPFLIHQVAQSIAKYSSTTQKQIISEGIVTNTKFASTVKQMTRQVSASANVTKSATSISNTRVVEPEIHTKSAQQVGSEANASTIHTSSDSVLPSSENAFEPANIHSQNSSQHSAGRNTTPLSTLIKYAVGLYLANNIPQRICSFDNLHTLFVVAVMGYIAIQIYLGPTQMSARRKVMISTWTPSDSGNIYGSIHIDVSKTLEYIASKRKEFSSEGDHKITITHIVLRALAQALKKAPSVNGHIVMGKYYPMPSVDMCCLVAIENGKDLQAVTINNAEDKGLQEIAAIINNNAKHLRSGKDKTIKERNVLFKLIPTFLLRRILKIVGWLSQCLGLEIKLLGVKPYSFGQVMVTSVGMMGLDEAYAPLTPATNVPMLILIGAITKKPVVENDQLVIKPMLTLTATIDHRYVDGAQAAIMAKNLKEYVANPACLDI